MTYPTINAKGYSPVLWVGLTVEFILELLVAASTPGILVVQTTDAWVYTLTNQIQLAIMRLKRAKLFSNYANNKAELNQLKLWFQPARFPSGGDHSTFDPKESISTWVLFWLSYHNTKQREICNHPTRSLAYRIVIGLYSFHNECHILLILCPRLMSRPWFRDRTIKYNFLCAFVAQNLQKRLKNFHTQMPHRRAFHQITMKIVSHTKNYACITITKQLQSNRCF